MPPKLKFQEGEKVLCFHGPLLYEAKCLKAEVKDKIARYFIHYNGWNKNWDEWVPENRVQKYNEAGLQKQKELKKVSGAAAKAMNRRGEKGKKPDDKDEDEEGDDEKDSKSADSTPATAEKVERKRPGPSLSLADSGTPLDQPRRKRARTDASVESEEQFVTKLEVRIHIPDDLRQWLVDDWDLVTRQKHLVQLPCRVTVDNILDDYVKHRLSKDASASAKEEVNEVVKGLREYFNVTLGSQLLYKFERLQYSEILSDTPNTPKSRMYGSSHLLRLFVKLGGHLSYTQLDETSTSLLTNHLHSFLEFLNQNSTNFFKATDYIVATPDYQRKAL